MDKSDGIWLAPFFSMSWRWIWKIIYPMEAWRYSNVLLPWLCDGRINVQFFKAWFFWINLYVQGLIITAAENNWMIFCKHSGFFSYNSLLFYIQLCHVLFCCMLLVKWRYQYWDYFVVLRLIWLISLRIIIVFFKFPKDSSKSTCIAKNRIIFPLHYGCSCLVDF